MPSHSATVQTPLSDDKVPRQTRPVRLFFLNIAGVRGGIIRLTDVGDGGLGAEPPRYDILIHSFIHSSIHSFIHP